MVVAAALVSHGQELVGIPPRELLACAGMVCTAGAAAIVRAVILGSSST